MLADTAGKWPKVEQVTSELMYVRLHGDKELYASGYSDDGPRRVGRRSAAAGRATGRDVYVYFDNDIKGFAPYDAMRLIERLS